MTNKGSDALCCVSRAVLVATAFTMAGCAIGQSRLHGGATLDISSIQEIEVKTSGISIACTPVYQPISGRALYTTPTGDRRPVSDAEFWVVSGSQEGRHLDIRVDTQGWFAGEVLLWDHELGSAAQPAHTEFIPGQTVVALRAPGCEDVTVEVSHHFAPVTVTMTCPGRK